MTKNLSKTNLETAKINFSKQLNKALFKKYDKKTSVVFFVNQFNLRAHGTHPIAYETGRKWLNGATLPQLSKLQILIDWLDLDMQKLFTITEHKQVVSDILSTKIKSAIEENLDKGNILSQIINLTLELNLEHQSLLLATALILNDFSKKENPSFLYHSFLNVLNAIIESEK
jgi:hypothetical protein